MPAQLCYFKPRSAGKGASKEQQQRKLLAQKHLRQWSAAAALSAIPVRAFIQINISTAGIFLASCSSRGWVFSVWGLVGIFWFVFSQRHSLLMPWLGPRKQQTQHVLFRIMQLYFRKPVTSRSIFLSLRALNSQ